MNNFTNADFDALFSQVSPTDLYAVFDRHVKNVPEIQVNKLTDIPEPIAKEQIYRLPELPPIETISKLSEEYYYGDNEVGIVAIKGHLLMAISSLSDPSAIVLPSALKPLKRKKLFQLDFHSHPKNVVLTRVPKGTDLSDWPGKVSPEDLTFMHNTINGQLGVGEFNGLISLSAPSKSLPNRVIYNNLIFDESNFQTNALGSALNYYEASKGKARIDADKHPMEYFYLVRDFLQEFFGYRLIPWKNKFEIEQWFKNQINLKTNF